MRAAWPDDGKRKNCRQGDCCESRPSEGARRMGRPIILGWSDVGHPPEIRIMTIGCPRACCERSRIGPDSGTWESTNPHGRFNAYVEPFKPTFWLAGTLARPVLLKPRPFKASPKRGSEVSHACGKNKDAARIGQPFLGGWEGLKSNRRSFGSAPPQRRRPVAGDPGR